MYVSNIHTCLEASDIDTYMLGGLRHTYIHAWRSMLRQASRSSKNQVSSKSLECFKTLTETKVWTHFLVQAGYLDFWRGVLKRILIENS